MLSAHMVDCFEKETRVKLMWGVDILKVIRFVPSNWVEVLGTILIKVFL